MNAVMLPPQARAATPPAKSGRHAAAAGAISPAAAFERPIERIVVLRALMLGDLLCATPALRALRHGFPGARIALVGLPWAAALVERLSCVDEFIEFPGWPGLPEMPCNQRALPAFIAKLQARRFDLALQLHGSGPIVNPLVASFGARYSAGFCNAASPPPPADAHRYVPWPEDGHEIERMLALTDRLGAPRRGLQIEFPLTAADRAELLAVWPGAAQRGSYVCVHAGAQLASRRWPVERYAEVANDLAEQGLAIVLTGTNGEAALVNALSAAIRHPVVNLVGRTTLWTLGALIEGAARLVCNDTGVSHVAAALGTPSVVVSCGSDAARWAPLDSARHAVLWQPMPCRPCSHAVCPIGHGCADAIGVDEVLHALRQAPAWSADVLRSNAPTRAALSGTA